MRHCGSVDTVSSYRRITKDEDSPTKSRNVVKLGGQSSRGKGSSRSKGKNLSDSPGASKVMGISSAKAPCKEKSDHRKVGILDLLVGYNTLLQLSTTPIIIQEKQLYPTIGFVQKSMAPADGAK